MPKKTTDGIDPKKGYRVLSPGFLPGQVCDPDHDGDMDYGSSYSYNADGEMFVYRRDKD